MGDDAIGQIFHIQYYLIQSISRDDTNPIASITPICPQTIQGYNIYDCEINYIGTNWSINDHLWPTTPDNTEYEVVKKAGSPAWSVDIWGVYTSQMTYSYWLSQGLWLSTNDAGLSGSSSGNLETLFVINGITTYRLDATNRDIVDAINELEGSFDGTAIVREQQETNRLIQEQTEQQQNQYEQEKQEEAQREQQGQTSSNTLGSLFSFTAFNPFSGIFALFTGGGSCVPIPTVASMINSSETTFCPFFPSSIRSIATPVMGISSMMLIFGFFVRWLNDGSFDGAVEV